jgi:hypothetical protein
MVYTIPIHPMFKFPSLFLLASVTFQTCHDRSNDIGQCTKPFGQLNQAKVMMDELEQAKLVFKVLSTAMLAATMTNLFGNITASKSEARGSGRCRFWVIS